MKKFLTYVVCIALLLLVMLQIYYGVTEVGIKLRETNVSLEIAFYVLTVFLFYVLILNPMLTIMFAPYYSVSRFCDEKDTNNGGIRTKARNLIKYGELQEEEISKLEEALKDHSSSGRKKLSNRMYIIYNNQIRKNIDRLVVNSSRDTLIMTAVSQSHFVDMLVVLVNNFRMLKKIIRMCGFRPTFIRTLKLFINVFSSSLIADGIQKIEISSLISTSIKGSAKVLTDSAMTGAINAFFMLRIGMLTKNYLYAEDPKIYKETLRSNSYVEAIKLFPNVIAALITSPIKGIASLFKGEKKEDTTNEEEQLPDVKWERKKKSNS